MKKLKLFYLLPLFFMGCSKVGVGYSIGTNQIQDKVDDAFAFSPRSKSKDIDHFLSEEFRKNKKIFFEKSKALILDFHKTAQKDVVTSANGDLLHARLTIFQKEMIELFTPSFKKVLNAVGDSEIQVFNEYSVEKVSEKMEDFSDKKDFKNKKMKNFVRVAEFLLGDLGREQRKIMEKFVDDHMGFYEAQILARKKFNADLIRLYPEKDKMIHLSLAYYSGDRSVYADTYKGQLSNFEVEMKDLILKIWSMRTPEQKAFYLRRIDEIIKEIDKVLAS